ncbi:MAG: hypothetical protein PUD63_06610 [Clostridia bacterium]|nr:hypothetical protein [Clostridia bacterium]MDD6040850.1 hypothetical protein [Clostridia bacterium]
MKACMLVRSFDVYGSSRDEGETGKMKQLPAFVIIHERDAGFQAMKPKKRKESAKRGNAQELTESGKRCKICTDRYGRNGYEKKMEGLH